MSARTMLMACFTAVCTAGLLGGCGPKITHKVEVNLVETNYCAMDKLLQHVRKPMPHDGKILAATFVDLDDVTSASTFGRVTSELCTARLTQRGYNVVNMKVRRDSVAIVPNSGEFMLSRDVRQLSQDYEAQTLLVGTYTRTRVVSHIKSFSRAVAAADPYAQGGRPQIEVVDDYVYVSLRLIKAEDNSVIAAYDYRIPVDDGVESLLTGVAGAEMVVGP